MNREQIEMIVWHYETLKSTAHKAVLNEEMMLAEFERSTKEMLLKRAGFVEDYDEDGPCGWTHNVLTCDEREAKEESIDLRVEQIIEQPYAIDHWENDNPNVVSEREWLEYGPFIVTATRTTQRYGGPEEGGWYYGSDDLVKWCALPTLEMAQWLAEMMNRDAKCKRDGNFAALGGDDTVSSTYPEGYIPSGWSAGSEMYYQVTNQAIDFEQQQQPRYC